MTLPNTLHAKVGDVVTVEVPDKLILTMSLKLYGLPVLAFVLVGGLSFVLAEKAGLSGDLFSAIGGLIGAASVWRWFMQHTNNLEVPSMVAIQR